MIKPGMTFGDWTVLSLHSINKRFNKMWLCKCKCGIEKPVSCTSLPNGNSKGCGCEKNRLTVIRSTKHGFAPRSGRTPEYRTWQEIMKRCHCPTNSSYHRYGGRGIKVCERWKNVVNFIADIPTKPPGRFSLGRIDNNKGYEPGNVRWENDFQQARNKRNNRIINYNGKSFCLSELCELMEVEYNLIRRRLNRGWSIEKAINTPNLCAT